MEKLTKRISAILLAASLLLASACSSAPAGSETSGGDTSSAAEESSAAENSQAEESEPEANGGDGNQAANATDIAGTWEITAVEQDGERLSDAEIQDALGGSGMRLEINADGTFDAVLLEDGEEVDTSAGEWTQNGDEISMDADGDVEIFILSGDTLVSESDGMTLIFEKK